MTEHSPARARIVQAMLPLAAESGWNRGTLRAAAVAAGEDPALIDSHFPDGPDGAIALWASLADQAMADAAGDLGALRVPDRVRRLIGIRLRQAAPHKRALRRALARLTLQGRADLGASITARTASAIWYAAGDTSADFSWYTRRVSLGAIYAATLGWWLRDDDPDTADALAFLDRRLADLARLQRPRRRA